MSLTWRDLQKEFDDQIHAQDFDQEKAVAARFRFGASASLKDILGLTLHECFMNAPRAKPINVVMGRCLAVLAECAAPVRFRANFLITHGGFADLEDLQRFYGNSGPLAVDVQVLNEQPERKITLFLDRRGDKYFKPESLRFVSEHLWDWVDYQYSLREAISKCPRAEVVEQLLAFKPLDEFCTNVTFTTEALSSPSVLSKILRTQRFENGQQGQALRASILSGNRDLVTGISDLIAQRLEARQDVYSRQSEASVFKCLLNTYFPGGAGADAALLRLARNRFERILDDGVSLGV